jgi:hypothetical protein
MASGRIWRRKRRNLPALDSPVQGSPAVSIDARSLGRLPDERWSSSGHDDRPGLHGDQVAELVASVRLGGQPERAVRRELLNRVFERGGRGRERELRELSATPCVRKGPT